MAEGTHKQSQAIQNLLGELSGLDSASSSSGRKHQSMI